MQNDLRPVHKILIKKLTNELSGNTEKLRVKKKTISNLFRYEGRKNVSKRAIDLSDFNKPLFLDRNNLTLEVQGLTTYEQIVDYTLPSGLLPLITPELKHITVGGATVGIGIESNSHKYGFVHHGLIEADVLLSNGKVVTCSANNRYSDLFNALPNSYGTLGYVLRAKIKLRQVLPFMQLSTRKYKDTKSYLLAVEKAANSSKNDSVEGLIYSKTELYLTTIRQTSSPKNLKSIYGNTIFYKEISKEGEITLNTKDYIFRYDPEWFWNMPDSKLIEFFRKLAPSNLRNSAFYAKYAMLTARLPFTSGVDPETEELIQDWEVPFRYAKSLIEFVLSTVNLCKKPLMVALIKVPRTATLYPMKKNQLYFNLGSYSFVKKKKGQSPFYNTKVIDKFCFGHQGIKMLYSTTFLNKSEFDKIYNGKAYLPLKKKYDPLLLLPTLFEKAVQSH